MAPHQEAKDGDGEAGRIVIASTGVPRTMISAVA
jgi:hypothetical protein